MGAAFVELTNHPGATWRPGTEDSPMPIDTLSDNVAAENACDAPDWTTLQSHLSTAVASSLDSPAALASNPDELRAAIDHAVVAGLGIALQSAVERWASAVIGAERYERLDSRVSYRSGVREHTFHFSVGPVSVRVPKPRQGPSRPSWIPVLKKAPEQLKALVRTLWVRGLSLRDLAKVSPDVVDRSWSHSTMAAWVSDVADETLRWLNRPVRRDVRHLVLDGLYVPFVRDSSRKEALLVALGITADGHKEVLDVLHAPTESIDSWATVLSRLKMRGLPVDKLESVITDGDAGLIAAVAAELPEVPRQRCTVHKVRNVVGRSSRELKKTAPAEAAAIYKAPSRTEAKRRAAAFVDKYSDKAPHLAAIVADDLDACLRFYDHDADRWSSLRSTNALERINREFRRKLREVGAMKGEVNVTRIGVQVARLVNEDTKDKPIAGFRKQRRR